MKVKKFHKLLFILFYFSSLFLPVVSQTYYEYLPLKAGNVWVYYNWGMLPGPNRSKLTVTGTHFYGGKMYYDLQLQFNASSGCLPNPLTYNVINVRIDSVTGIISFHNSTNCTATPQYIQLDSLMTPLNGTFKSNCSINYSCIDTANYTIFGTSRGTRKYRTPGSGEYYVRRYAKGIGLYEQSHSLPGIIDCNSILMGAVLNGTVIGDTSIPVGIIYINQNVPENFKLYQNYPNPFNPATTIRFNIPVNHLPLSGGDPEGVNLKIYDILGNEIAVLVNGKLAPGTYEYQWDASAFPSGVYFFKLNAGDFSAVNKMILIK